MTEKRNFFRVDKDVLFDCRSVDAYTAENEDAGEQFDDHLPLKLFAEFRQIDRQGQELLHAIGETNRPVADYLKGINQKIDLLCREMIAEKRPQTQQTSAKINLSESGIAFLADKPYYMGSYLALRLVFLPSYTGVVLFAKVMRSEAAKGDRHHIAAKFHRLGEPEQQILAKTILETQMAAKRQTEAPLKSTTE